MDVSIRAGEIDALRGVQLHLRLAGRREEDAANFRHLAALRNLVSLDESHPLAVLRDGDLWGLDLAGSTIDDRDLCHIRHLESLRRLVLPETLSVDVLASLAGLHELVLNDSDPSLEWEDERLFASIGAIKALRELTFGPADPVPPSVIGELARLAELRILRLPGVRFIGETETAFIGELTSLEELNLSSWPADTDLTPLAGLLKLRRVTLSSIELHPGLESLGNLTLDSFGAWITGDWVDPMEELVSSNSLGVLDLRISVASDAPSFPAAAVVGVGARSCGLSELERIAALPGLETLRIWSNPSEHFGAFLARLTPARTLKTLELTSFGAGKLSADGLRELRHLPHLEDLSLVGFELDDRALQAIGELSTLRSLDLAMADVKDTSLQYLKSLTRLEFLDVEMTSVTERGLRALDELPRLRHVEGGMFRGYRRQRGSEA